jgi:ATP-dependent RNA helicase DeaD
LNVAETFTDLGLSDALAAAVQRLGYERPTPLQASATPVLRRGGNVVLHASSGAGVTAAFALPLLDRLAGGTAATAARALVLAATQQRAESVAQAMAQMAEGTAVTVRALAPGWRPLHADVVVASAQRALEAVQTSELKLDDVQTLVVTDAGEIYALGSGAALDTIVSLVPKDAQRVVVSASLDGDVHTFIETHVRRALTVPARPAAPPRTPAAAEPLGQIGYMIVEDLAKIDTLARLLESVEDDALVHARSAQRAAMLRSELTRRGLENVRVTHFDEPGTAHRVVSFDVPFSVDELRAAHANGGTVLVTPMERAHFRRLATEAPFTLKQRRARSVDTGEVDAFRASVRAALQAEDLAAQLLVLDPLFAESAPAEVAAALSALLRRRAPAAGAAAAVPSGTTGAPPAEATAGGFTRLFVSVGTRDNIRPGDIVGAITGEANIKGDQVGRVDIRESFSVVEVASSVAERVIRALNGTTMRGRSLRVDFDRKGISSSGSRERGGPRGAGPRAGGPRGRPRDEAGGASPPRRRPPER